MARAIDSLAGGMALDRIPPYVTRLCCKSSGNFTAIGSTQFFTRSGGTALPVDLHRVPATR